MKRIPWICLFLCSLALGCSRHEGSYFGQRKSSLKQFGFSIQCYHDAYLQFPKSAIYSKDGKPLLSWRVLLLPYVEQQALYGQFKLDEPWDSEHNIKLLPKMPKVYRTPGVVTKEPFTTYYQVFTGKGTLFDSQQEMTLGKVTGADGAANTMMMAEAGEEVPWTKPEDMVVDPAEPLPEFGGNAKGFFALFVDGSVRWIKKGTSEKTIRALITWDGGEEIPKNEIP